MILTLKYLIQIEIAAHTHTLSVFDLKGHIKFIIVLVRCPPDLTKTNAFLRALHLLTVTVVA